MRQATGEPRGNVWSATVRWGGPALRGAANSACVWFPWSSKVRRWCPKNTFGCHRFGGRWLPAGEIDKVVTTWMPGSCVFVVMKCSTSSVSRGVRGVISKSDRWAIGVRCETTCWIWIWLLVFRISKIRHWYWRRKCEWRYDVFVGLSASWSFFVIALWYYLIPPWHTQLGGCNINENEEQISNRQV